MDEGIKPSIYEVIVGWTAQSPVLIAFAIADTIDEALRGANRFVSMYPWPADAPDIVSIKLLHTPDNIIISNKYRSPLTPDDTQESTW
jgi:hypothetical protein